MFGKRCEVAAWNAVAPQVALFEMSSNDSQLVAVPSSGGEALPGVGSIRGRVGAPVHPDGSLLRLPLHVRVVSNYLLSWRVHVLPDPQIGWAARAIVGGMRPALPLRQGLNRFVPAIGAQAGCVV